MNLLGQRMCTCTAAFAALIVVAVAVSDPRLVDENDVEAFGLPADVFHQKSEDLHQMLPWSIGSGGQTRFIPPPDFLSDVQPLPSESSLPLASAAVATVHNMTTQVASNCRPPKSVSSTLCAGTVSYVICSNKSADGTITYNASCSSPADGLTAVSGPNTNATSVLLEAIVALLLKMDASPTHIDCACVNQSFVADQGCTFTAATCTYYLLFVDPINHDVYVNTSLVRSKGWRVEKPQYIGASKGWTIPSEGYQTTDASNSMTDALYDLRSKHPEAGCNQGKVPPLIVIPGLTSSALNYKLDGHSAPPPWAFWCNKTTDGQWEPLWPVSPETTSHVGSFLCWAANIEVKFDPATKTFGPVRTGLQTELVNFGNFSGINGIDTLVPYFSMLGWTPGKDLFAAPFDWRVPSVGQAEFFSKLKALVETASESNGNQKVALWAFSYGPQFTLSFLHRMTQEWKDKYIAWFVATSPVWSGAPAALFSFSTGYAGDIGGGGEVPNPPKQCSALTLYQDVCYSGAPAKVVHTDLAGCCQEISSDGPYEIFNHFDNNQTCELLSTYTGTYKCVGGVLGYHSNETGRKVTTALPSASPNTGTAFVRTLARASPSLVWSFPRAGTNSTVAWNSSDVLISTKSKKYTAYDIPQLLHDIGLDKKDSSLWDFVSNEPDLGSFEPPGVDTLVTYGHNISTLAAMHFDKDFDGALLPNNGVPNATLSEDGDGLVPLRSSLRGEIWQNNQNSHRLLYRGYINQPHAQCFISTTAGNAGAKCWSDVMNLLVHGADPPS